MVGVGGYRFDVLVRIMSLLIVGIELCDCCNVVVFEEVIFVYCCKFFDSLRIRKI